MSVQASAVDEVVGRALAEDAPWGDLTCAALVPPSAISTAELTAREPGTFAGGAAVEAAFRLTDPAIAVELLVADGETFDVGACWLGSRDRPPGCCRPSESLSTSRSG